MWLLGLLPADSPAVDATPGHQRQQKPTQALQVVICYRYLPLQIGDDLRPTRVLDLFKKITVEDCVLLDVRDRPENLLMTHVPVPPVAIRPSVEMDSGQGSNEDDITVKIRVGCSSRIPLLLAG